MTIWGSGNEKGRVLPFACVPLVLSTGAGAEMRYAMGVAVFFGMLGVTLFGLLFTPVFYVALRLLATRGERARTSEFLPGVADTNVR